MFSRLRSYRPHHGTVVAYLSLFLVLTGGSAVALTGRNTVFSDDITNGEVKRPDLANNAVTGGKVADNSLRSNDVANLTGADVTDNSLAGSDVNESTFGPVPVAQNAGNAGALDGKDSTAYWSGADYFVDGPTTDNSAGSTTSAEAECDVGDRAIGGGYSGLQASEGTVEAEVPEAEIRDFVGQRWAVTWRNAEERLDSNVQVRVHCADFPPLR
jgi:hypothetical protein